MIIKLIMWLCHIKYKKMKKDIIYIKGTDEKYPRFLLYTEDENVYKRWEDTEL